MRYRPLPKAEARLALIAAVLLIVVLLQGCASSYDLVKTRDVRTAVVTWDREIPQTCGDTAHYTGEKIAGCAHVNIVDHRCTIEMAEDAPNYLVAEEFRHCFGYEHRR